MLTEAISEVHLEQTSCFGVQILFQPFLEPFEPGKEGEGKEEGEEEMEGMRRERGREGWREDGDGENKRKKFIFLRKYLN